MSEWPNSVLTGDVRDRLGDLPDNSVHMAMTSPPYFGLRDYGHEDQIGLEDELDAYIEELVGVFREVRRVLRSDGSAWVNLGDSFAGSGRGQWTGSEDAPKESYRPDSGELPVRSVNLRRKSKMLVPHRVAIALQDDGWIVRSDAVWSKPNPMPHPVKDRLNEHKEFIFHLTPEPDYWFDLDAIREPHKTESLERNAYAFNSAGIGSTTSPREDRVEDVVMDADDACHPNGKNPGDIFDIPVKAFPDAHFAVYPPELCERPIKASAPEHVCADCGAAYKRLTKQVPMWERDRSTIVREQTKRALEIADEAGLSDEHFEAARAVGIGNLDGGEGNPYERVDEQTAKLARKAEDVLGSYFREALMSETEASDEWRQSCDCDTDAREPGIVLDPFAGAGTTLLKAKELGRRFVGVELNPEYADMARARIGLAPKNPANVRADDEQKGFEAFATDGGGR